MLILAGTEYICCHCKKKVIASMDGHKCVDGKIIKPKLIK